MRKAIMLITIFSISLFAWSTSKNEIIQKCVGVKSLLLTKKCVGVKSLLLTKLKEKGTIGFVKTFLGII
jgi:hypothetical protein